VDIVPTWYVIADASDIQSDVRAGVQCSCHREIHCHFDNFMISLPKESHVSYAASVRSSHPGRYAL
jgi:hypothetical protein